MDILVNLDVHIGFRILEIHFHTSSHIPISFAMIILELSARRHQGCRPVLIYPGGARSAIQCLLNRGNITEEYAARQIVIGCGGAKTGNHRNQNDQNCYSHVTFQKVFLWAIDLTARKLALS